MHSPLPAKPTLTMLTLLALLALPDAVPRLKDYRVLDWRTVPSVLDLVPRRNSLVEDEVLRLHPERDAANLSIPEGSLDRFYEALRRTESRQEGAVTRILHYGDSPTTADLITGDARRLLQKQFGDAGHGFCLMGQPWAWYGHYGVSLQSSGWTIEPASQVRGRDGFFGLGGVSFRGGPGVATRITLREANHTRVELSFQYQPGGGSISAAAEGRVLGKADTRGAGGPGYAAFSIPAGARRFAFTVEGGPVRSYGVSFERPGPGITYDSLGLNGAYVSVLARMFDERHWAEQLRHRRPNLVIVNYGTNESEYAPFVDQVTGNELKEIVRRLRAAVPEASILLMSPMDRGQREAGGVIGTLPTIPRLVAIQQQVAAETGCAYFNTFQAMGGEGAMGRWYAAEPRLVGADFIHPMPAGAKIVGTLLYQALMDGYNRYKVRLLQQRMAHKKPQMDADGRR